MLTRRSPLNIWLFTVYGAQGATMEGTTYLQLTVDRAKHLLRYSYTFQVTNSSFG